MKYAGFKSRLLALLLDVLILFPLIVLSLWMRSQSSILALLSFVITFGLWLYQLYFIGRYGQTPGKMIAGIQIVKLNGSQVGWQEAFARSSVDIIFSTLILLSDFVSLIRVPAGLYETAPYVQKN